MSRLFRTLHIYSSMLVLILMIFFAITGITLNHPDWQWRFGAQTKELQVQVPSTLLAVQWSDDELSQAQQIQPIADWFRQQHAVQGAVMQFNLDVEEGILELDFKQPAGFYNISIDLATQQADLSHEFAGALALLNDLHKGRYAGQSWKWLIDITAICCLLFCLSGFYLLWRQPSRRRSGVNAAVFGVVCMLLAYVWALH